MESLREYERVWLVGELGNFWQLGKLGQVWGKHEKNGEMCRDVGGGKGGVERCVGGGVGKCVRVVGRCWESGKV